MQKEGANEEAKEEAVEGKLEPQEVKFSTKGSETAKEETHRTENAEGISSNKLIEEPDENGKANRRKQETERDDGGTD